MEDGRPGLLIFNTCPNLIKELSQLVFDKYHTEDVDSRLEDHCLISSTLVKTKRGDVPISEVVVGDKVLTRQGYKKVLSSWMESPSSDVIKVTFSNGSHLIGTGNHPVWVENKGWVRLDALQYPDSIAEMAIPSSRSGTVCAIETREAGKQAVYNLEVEGANEFYANGILVHNSYDALRYALTSVREYKKVTQPHYQKSPLLALERI